MQIYWSWKHVKLRIFRSSQIITFKGVFSGSHLFRLKPRSSCFKNVIWSQTSCALCHTKNVLQSPLLKKWLQLEKYSICPAAGLCKRQQQERQIPPTEAIKLLLLLLCIFSQKSGFSSCNLSDNLRNWIIKIQFTKL